MEYSLNISEENYSKLKQHLFPGDGKEAVSIALCGRHNQNSNKQLFVHELISIPYDQCEIRESDYIKWSTAILIPYLTKAITKNLAVVKIHSHPTGYPDFSETDNRSDIDLFDSIYGWMNNEEPHGSLIMLQDGRLFGRIITSNLTFVPINKIILSGHDIRFWFNKNEVKKEEFSKRTAQTFGNGTTSLLRKLKIGVVGCSGTGSPVIEQLVRLGIGHIVLIDPDKVEIKNLNRILNTTIEDAKKKCYKVNVLRDFIKKIGLNTKVTIFNKNLYDSIEAINELATCDVIFGCVDSIDGRYLLNQLSTFFIIPYFDLGVKIIADNKGGVDQICGTVHYVRPGGSSLISRGLYTNEDIRAAGLFRIDKNEYNNQKKSGYIVNVNVESPAVISINMQVASIAINEFLARIHPFRYDSSEEFAITRFSLSDGYFQHESEGSPDKYLQKFLGRGAIKPILNMPELDV